MLIFKAEVTVIPNSYENGTAQHLLKLHLPIFALSPLKLNFLNQVSK